MRGEMATKSTANTVIWFFASLTWHFPAQAYLEINAPFAFLSFIFLSLCFALIGTAVQGMFIGEDNFKKTPFLSIVKIGTSVMTIFLLPLAVVSDFDLQFIFHAALIYLIPAYLVTTISYYASR